jgi:hypothetical protein
MLRLSDAEARMQAIGLRLDRGDGVRHFNALYLGVTREVLRRLAAGDFEDPRFLERLAAGFSQAYFDALDAPTKAWAPLLERRRDRRVAPIQFALAGMNAHINFDLPLGVVATCAALGLEPVEGTPHARDYDRLNGILAALQEEAKRRLTGRGLLARLDRALGPLDDVVASFKVARARDAAWVHAQALWAVRGDAALSGAYRLTLGRSVGLAGRGLLVPTRLVPRP